MKCTKNIYSNKINAAYPNSWILESSSSKAVKVTLEKMKSTKRKIIKEGLKDWLEETALHGLKYMNGQGGILGFILWVRCENLRLAQSNNFAFRDLFLWQASHMLL